MIIREVKESDAENLMDLIQEVEKESEFMLMEPGERESDLKKQSSMIRNLLEEDNSMIFVAEEDRKLAGYLIALGGKARRTRHSVYIVIGICKLQQGKGIGTKLLSELEKWALSRNIHRLELTSAVKNERGLSLYKKMGFEIEGTKRHSMYIRGDYMDEYYMSKLI